VKRAPRVRGLGFLSAWGRGTAALPDDARVAAAGRRVLSLGRLEREGERFRRATREGLLALTAVELALDDAGAGRDAIAGPETALIYVTAGAYAASNRRFIEGRGGSIRFAETAPAVVPAEVSIELGVAGPYAIFIGGAPATLRAIWHGALLLDAGVCERALVLAVEIFEECADLVARMGRRTGIPLVEAASCLWIEPGTGTLRIESAGRGVPSSAIHRRLGETLCCEPLAALDLWRRRGAAGPVELTGRWRGECARLVWTDPLPRERAA